VAPGEFQNQVCCLVTLGGACNGKRSNQQHRPPIIMIGLISWV
jgi:hypothetical protein